MGFVQDSIGLKWERELELRYPSLERKSDNNVPDFYHQAGFWVEAKAGNKLWGGRVKDYQFEQEAILFEPVIYAFGMHDLDDATGLVVQTTEDDRQRFLDRNLNFVEIYLISGVIVHKINEREKRVSKKAGEVYCMVKPSLLRNILLDRNFTRFGQRINSSAKYYGFRRRDYEIGINVGKNSNVSFMLHKTWEKSAIDELL